MALAHARFLGVSSFASGVGRIARLGAGARGPWRAAHRGCSAWDTGRLGERRRDVAGEPAAGSGRYSFLSSQNCLAVAQSH